MKYRIGWFDDRQNKWRYITVDGDEAMFGEVADKVCLSDKVSIRVVKEGRKK